MPKQYRSRNRQQSVPRSPVPSTGSSRRFFEKMPLQPPSITLVPPLLLLTSLLIPPTASVSIKLTSPPHGIGHAITTTTCTGISPGICCISVDMSGARTARFTDLAVGDIAAVWGPRHPDDFDNGHWAHACSNVVLDSHPGPGAWNWASSHQGRLAQEVRASGASYIVVPRHLPPDEKASAWMAAEGMLGMVWGGGEWFGSLNAKTRWGVPRRRSKVRRDVRSVEKGRLWAGPPPRAVWPDLVEMGGKVYRGNGSGPVMVADGSGVEVDVTELFGDREKTA
ncbi:MAG: hypothetical protein LQ344_006701 [Seirophora lacunosa]|nr:MAG: hypothetical protein LQ344_006701 [Seirophora lacunosa]